MIINNDDTILLYFMGFADEMEVEAEVMGQEQFLP